MQSAEIDVAHIMEVQSTSRKVLGYTFLRKGYGWVKVLEKNIIFAIKYSLIAIKLRP